MGFKGTLQSQLGDRSRVTSDALALAVWTAAVALFFWPVLSGQRVLFYFDITELNYPYRAYFGHQIQQGRFPLWCPHLYCGFPLFAESQTGYLYPLKYLLYTWMPPWLAFGYDTVLSVWLAGVAMYVYLRRSSLASGREGAGTQHPHPTLPHSGGGVQRASESHNTVVKQAHGWQPVGFAPAAALAGAVPFGYGGFMAAHLIHTSYVNSMMWIPLAFLAMERLWVTGRIRYGFGAAVCLAMQILAGNMQIAILTNMALAVMAIYWAIVALAERRFRTAWTVLGSTAAVGVLSMALGAVQILPAKQLLDHSPRRAGLSYDELTGLSSWHPELLPTLFLPNAYGSRSHNTDWLDGYYWYHEMYVYLGVTTLLLACVGAAGWRSRWVFGHLVLTAVCLLLMLGRYTFLYDFFTAVPILRGMRAPVRESVWLGLSVGALAAVGVERLRRMDRLRLKGPLVAFAGLAVVAVAIMIAVYFPYLRGDQEATKVLRQSSSPLLGREQNWVRHQRLVGQIVSDAVSAAILTAAAVFIMVRLSRSASWQRRGRLAAALPLLVLFDVFWAGRHLAPTVRSRYWSRPPAVVDVLRQVDEPPRIYPLDVGLHNAPGYAVNDSPNAEGVGNSLLPSTWWSVPTVYERAVQGIPLSVPAVWGIDSMAGHTPIHPERIARYLALGREPSQPFRFLPWQFDVAAVTHLVAPPGMDMRRAGIGPPQWQGIEVPAKAVGNDAPPPASLYRNLRALPRVRLIDRVVYASDMDEAESLLRSGELDPRHVLVVEDHTQPLTPALATNKNESESPGYARILAHQSEHIEVLAEVKRPSYLFLAESYYPEWQVRVDGRPREIRPAQLAFQAVFLEPGQHRVELVYRRRAFSTGLVISAMAVIVGSLLWWSAARWRWPELEPRADLPAARFFAWGLVVFIAGVLLMSLVTQGHRWSDIDEGGPGHGIIHTYRWDTGPF